MATPEPHFHSAADVAPLSVERRVKKRITEESSSRCTSIYSC
jgi:hypothetical protein